MCKCYKLSLYVRVYDEPMLIATARATAAGGCPPEIAPEIGDARMALRWLLDPGDSPPGCEILDSTCE
jgi:hypothetical protein